MKNSLLNEAIADAKALQQAAIANAKSILSETFEPTIRRMVSQKLSEEDEMEEDPVMENEYTEDDPAMIESDEMDFEDDGLELESILRELEDEEDPLGAPAAPVAPVAPAVPAPVAAPADPLAATYSEPAMAPEVDVTDDELDEILREMEDEDSLDEILREMEDEGCDTDMEESVKLRKENRSLKTELATAKSNLREAYSTVNKLKTYLNETALLNTKLVYSTNLNRAFNMTEAQQGKMLNAFDKATTIREAKLIYTTLAESLKQTTERKSTLKESASKRIGIIKENKNIVPPNRLQILAGIK